MSNRTPDGHFSLQGGTGGTKITLALTNESLLIRVEGRAPMTFIADITEAGDLREWLIEQLAERDYPSPLIQAKLATIRRQRDDVTAALNRG